MADFPAVTPADSPSDQAGWDSVAVQQMNIQAPVQDLAAVTQAAQAVAEGPRQAATRELLASPQGYGAGGYNIDAGYSGYGGADGWPNDTEPDADGP